MRLRPLDPVGDAQALHAIYSDEASCRYLSHRPFATVAETRDALVKWTEGCEKTSWAIIEGDSSTALGRVSLIPRAAQVYEAAVMIVPAARGRGLARSAMRLALHRAFERGARRVYADIDPENHASLRLFEQLGFQREGYLRATWETHIGVRDTVLLALIAGDPHTAP